MFKPNVAAVFSTPPQNLREMEIVALGCFQPFGRFALATDQDAYGLRGDLNLQAKPLILGNTKKARFSPDLVSL